MGKGRRNQGPVHRAPERASTHETSTEFDAGNAAHAEELDGRYIPMDAAGDAAKPIVEQALMALELRYEGDTPIHRLLELLKGSDLPEESRAWLCHRLDVTAANVQHVERSIRDAFGQDDARERAQQVLEQVEAALLTGSAGDGGWTIGDKHVAVEPGTSVRQAVDHLVGALAGSDSTAAVSLVRSLAIGLVLDDDDEEQPILWPES